MNNRARCGQVKVKAEQKLDEVEKRIKDLNIMKRSLKKMINSCSNDEKFVTECPILECFEKDKRC